jgi:hypothetical protein
MRSAAVASCIVVVALVSLVGASGFRKPRPRVVAFADSAIGSVSRASQLQSSPFQGTTGGTYAAADGETVRIAADSSYTTADPLFNQRWADLLASAPHRGELQTVSVALLPLQRVQTFCGEQALACYSPESQVIIAPGDDPAPDLPASSILLHEYGHHVAQNRGNDPWWAVDYGPKRWASDKNVCRQAQNGVLRPGDEGSDYRLNPGEAWAETYRVLAERAVGLPEVPWTIVSSAFYPDDDALAAAQEDVFNPWTGNRTTVANGSFRGAQKRRSLRIVTPFDGAFSVALTNRTKGSLRLRLENKAGVAVATASVAARRTKSLRYSVCGERSLRLEVSRTTTGAGPYTATISKP